MIEERFQKVFEILNFEMTRKDIVILGAILKSQGDRTTFVDFETIRAQLATEEGGKKGKDSLIYRSLSGLEKTGFIRVDRSEHKHGYNSDVGLMHEVFRKEIKDATSKIENELSEFDSEIEQISRMDIDSLKEDMLALAAGEHKFEKPIFAEGWEDVLQLIDDRVYSHVKKGDLVRFSLDWFNRSDVLTSIRVERLAQLLEKGIIFQGLEHSKLSNKQREVFLTFRQAYGEQGLFPGYRVCERHDSTYQFVGRKNEGIVLIVSEKPMSATWIPRSANPDLVDNAIETFDTDYDKGIDITDMGGD